jgi:hypothetical protein
MEAFLLNIKFKIPPMSRILWKVRTAGVWMSGQKRFLG